MTKTEIQHVYFGLGLTVMAIAALLAWRRPDSRARWVWPSVAIVIGLFLFLPSETGEGHYRPRGWLQTLADLWPIRTDRWLSALAQLHVLQHKIAGAATLLVGGVELARTGGRLAGEGWRWVLPLGSIVAGAAITIHGGSAHHLPTAAEQLHHWVMGFAFVVGGGLLGFQRAGRLQDAWRWAWPVLVLVAGLDLVFLYRIPG